MFAAGAAPVRLPAAVAGLIERLQEFDTLEGHARRAGGEGEAGAAALETLRLAAQGNLLLEEGRLAEAMRRAATSDRSRSCRIRHLVLPTRNRAGLVARCLDSYLGHAREHGRRLDLLVLDDSDAGSRAATESAARRVGSGHDVQLHYANAVDTRRFAARVARAADVELEVLEFALAGQPGAAYGAMRNRALLSLAGEAFLSVDDDTICAPVPGPSTSPGLIVSGSPKFSDPRHFERPADARRLPIDRAIDYVGAHERMLGRAPLACLDAGSAAVRFEAASERQLRHVSDADARVAVTAGGYLGDAAGCVSAEYLDPADRDRVLRDRAGFRRIFVARTMLRVVERPTVSEALGWPAMTSGFDARRLLPPFFPSFRGEEATFAALLRACFPSRLVGLVPHAIRHRPAEHRRNRLRGLRAPTLRAAMATLLLGCLELSRQPQPRGPEARLHALADDLRSLARAEPLALAEHLREAFNRDVSRQIEWLERLLRRHGRKPAFWAEIVDERRRSLSKGLQREEAILAAELGADTLAVGMRRLQRLLASWGDLLEAWPAIFAAAQRLRAAGEGLGRTIRP